jgi:hypothetical protein
MQESKITLNLIQIGRILLMTIKNVSLPEAQRGSSDNSGVGVFFARQDAGLLPAKPDSGNCLAFYCRLFKTFTPTRTDAVFCLSRRQ